MKKILMMVIMSLMTAGCAGLQAAPGEIPFEQKIIEVPGMTKQQIYEKSRLWIAQNLKPYKAVWLFQRRTAPMVEYADAGQGIIIATGNIHYPHGAFSLTEGYKAYWEVTFTMEEDIKDGRIRVTFRNFDVYVPKLWCGNIYSEWQGAYDKPMTDPEDIRAVKPLLTGLADQLGEFLRSPFTGDQW